MRNVGAAGAQGDAEPAGASAEGDVGAKNLSTGTVGAEGTGAVGSGGEGGAGGERREPGIFSRAGSRQDEIGHDAEIF